MIDLKNSDHILGQVKHREFKTETELALFAHCAIYTESEQVCKFNDVVPSGITHSKQLCFRKPAKNEYTFN
jgi:hypothetical protein